MAIVTYIALAAAGYMTIVALQPKHLDAVWRRNRDKYALPLVAVSLAVARSMPAFWKLDCSFGTVLLSVRVATALALLGVAVVSRYVGPHSMSKYRASVSIRGANLPTHSLTLSLIHCFMDSPLLHSSTRLSRSSPELDRFHPR